MAAVLATVSSGTESMTHPGWSRFPGGFIALVFALMLAGQTPAMAQAPAPTQSNPFKPSISQASRENAVRTIPFDNLNADSRKLVRSVVSNVTIFRRMPVRVIQCDPELYQFLVEHPDVVANIWQVLRLSQITLQQAGSDTYRLTDAAGTDGTVRFLYHSADTHLIYAEGTYDGPLTTKPVRGRAVLLLKTGFVRQPDGRYYITTRLDTFMQVEPGGAELLTKVFQPLLGKIADLNFLQTVVFVGSLSKTAEVNTPGVRRLAARLTAVQPEVRDQFAVLAERVAQKSTGLTTSDPNRQKSTIAERPAETVTQ